ncbi:MAG: cation:dicarboxylate symporter family transporter, partial [Sphingobacterium sp.]
MNNLIKNYGSIILLLIGVTIGSIIGVYLPDLVDILKPIGDIFLNMLFVAVIPLLFFAISSSIANIQDSNKLGKTIGIMTTVFIVTIFIAAIATIAGLWA